MIARMFSGMTIDRVFFVYSAVLGVVVGAVLLMMPQSREVALGPFFWVLIGIALFEAVAVYRRGGLANGPPMAMPTRLIGFFIAVLPILVVS